VDDRLRERAAAAARGRTPNEAEQAALDDALRRRELVKGALLEVDEGRGPAPWEEVADFFDSGPADRHYLLNRTTGGVTFGDGERGRIPLAGINNLVARYYQSGGGAAANVGAGALSSLQSAVAGVESVTNAWPAEGGADEEPVAETMARAPRELKVRDRAVAAADFEFLATQTPGVHVGRAFALPLRHPQFPGMKVPGAVTVVVVPRNDDPRPVPTEATLRAVCAYLNDRRLVTTELFVAPPSYVRVAVEATLVARPTADPAQVKAAAEAAVTAFLHQFTGGPDGLGWPPGGPVLYSDIFGLLVRTDGVQAVQDLFIVLDGLQQGKCEDAAVPAGYLVYSDGHDLTVTYGTATA
jgi:predicted phage baseplate assembly protein